MASDAANLAAAAPFRLGEVEVRPATREVVAGAAREVLEPRVMQVLVALARERGEVVGRDALVRDCWDGRVVGDDAINRAIARLRRLAEGPAQGSFAIETIVKVGYRLVELRDGAPVEPPPAVTPLSAPVPRRALLVGAGVAAAAGAGWLGRRWLGPPAVGPAAAMMARAEDATRLGTADGTAQTVSFLREATKLEPGNARAWGALALAHQNNLYFLGDAAAEITRAELREAAARALALDPHEPGARTALALARPWYGAWGDSERALRAVLATDPTHIDAALALSRVMAAVGRNRAALDALRPALGGIKLLPYAQYWLARTLWTVGRPEESDAAITRALWLWPRNAQVWFTRFWLLTYTGRTEAALAMAADHTRRPSGIPDWNFALIDASARAIGDGVAIEAALAANDRAARTGRGFAENAVEVAAALGRADRAFAITDGYFFGRGFTIGSQRYSAEQSAYTRHWRWQTKFLFSPPGRCLRADPRFAALTRAIGLERYWRESGTRPDA